MWKLFCELQNKLPKAFLFITKDLNSATACLNDIFDSLRPVGGGGVLSPKSYVDVPAGPRKPDYLYTNFLPNFPPISIPFSKEKHPIWIKLGAFYNNLPKIHPIYVIWAPSSLMKTPRSLYQISRKSAPKGRHIYVYHVNVRTPPPPRKFTFIKCIIFSHLIHRSCFNKRKRVFQFWWSVENQNALTCFLFFPTVIRVKQPGKFRISPVSRNTCPEHPCVWS